MEKISYEGRIYESVDDIGVYAAYLRLYIKNRRKTECTKQGLTTSFEGLSSY